MVPHRGNRRSAITGYMIERSKDQISWMTLNANTGNMNTRYVDKNLAAATTWHYRVRAVNKAGAGNASSVVSGTTSGTMALEIPSGLVAVARGMSRIDLYWLMTNDPEGAPVTGYRIEVSSDGGATLGHCGGRYRLSRHHVLPHRAD